MRAKPTSTAGTVVSPKRNPTAIPTSSMIATTNTLRNRSERVRPASSAPRDIGSERNRSIRPRWRSSASPTPVTMLPKIAVWMKIPGIRKST